MGLYEYLMTSLNSCEAILINAYEDLSNLHEQRTSGHQGLLPYYLRQVFQGQL